MKGTLARYNGIQTPCNARIKPILGLCMPKNAHTNCISSVSRLKKKKKKDQPTDPPDFQAKRANKPFIFLGLTVF